jgi:hypothetical protein
MRRMPLLLVTSLILLIAFSVAAAQTGDFDLVWHTIDGGGSTSIGGDRFALSGTIGQPDAGKMSGGVYALQGGFWPAIAAPGARGSTVYLPLILR